MKRKPIMRPATAMSLVAVLLLFGIAAAVYLSGPAVQDSVAAQDSRASIAEDPPDPVVTLPEPAPAGTDQAPPASAAAVASVTEFIDGGFVRQTFTLNGGWNAVYLGVEPVNMSELIDPTKPELGHRLSVIEAVFEPLAGEGGPLESVWTYNQPPSHKDYIVDPGEGLWDAPGWERWLPKSNLGPDGVSREFLSTLYTLHANTGYLIKLKDGTSGSFLVHGRPAPGHSRWAAGYNLAGFPITPVAGQGPTVASFLPAASGITEVRGVTPDGKWTTALSGTDSLSAGTAYLVRYSEGAAAGASHGYAAPVDLMGPEGGPLPAEGLAFKAGLQGKTGGLAVKNLSAGPADVVLRLPAGANSPVALSYVDAQNVTHDLRTAAVTIAGIAANDGRQLHFVVPASSQPAAGEALLEVSCSALGTRWLVPISAEPGSLAGLWVGEVTVNTVSEAQLGATNFDTDLTVALVSLAESGVKGAAQIHDKLQGASHTLYFTVTLDLPPLPVGTVQWPAPTGLYVRGHVFVDENQNGQYDVGEPGLPGVQVNLGSNTAFTGADGAYQESGLIEGDHAVSASGDEISGYTTAFPVTIPAHPPNHPESVAGNQTPTMVTLGPDGATAVVPPEYLHQVLFQTTLPYYDAYDNRAEPPLNFGYVRQDFAAVYKGTCDAPLDKLFDLGEIKNGSLATSVAGHSVPELTGSAAHILVTWKGEPVACANLVAGSPTSFADGRGSQARFRVILRVAKSGQTALLPYYALGADRRVSSAIFLSTEPITVTGPFGTVGAGLEYNLTLPANDPLNPYKHKYNPDHDNLDRKFTDYQEEAFDIQRKVTFILSAIPYDGDTAAAAAMDWGGAVWGGEYREVVDNLHKNSITARGNFVIRHVLTADELVRQEYDK